MNSQINSIKVIFEEELTSLSIHELSNFLYYLKNVYASILMSKEFKYTKLNDIEYLVKNQKEISNQLKEFFQKNIIKYKSTFFKKNLYEKYDMSDLLIEKISKDSPLKVVFTGAFIAIVLALIFSGGKIKFSQKTGSSEITVEVVLNALGTGIKAYKDALKK